MRATARLIGLNRHTKLRFKHRWGSSQAFQPGTTDWTPRWMDGEMPAYTLDYRGKATGVATPGAERVLISVEHASDRLPPPYSWSKADIDRFQGNGVHWTYDPGARDFAKELAQELGCMAV